MMSKLHLACLDWACYNCPGRDKSPKGHCQKCFCLNCNLQKKCPGADDCIYDEKGILK